MQCYNCDAEALYWVTEVWSADVGAAEFREPCCVDCVAGPEHHDDGAFANYEFTIEPIPEAFGMSTTGD